MEISFSSKDLPREVLDLMVDQRITMRVTFEVDSVNIDSNREHDWEDRVGGKVKSFDIESTEAAEGKRGLDPVVGHAVRALKTMVHGTMG